MSEFSESDDDQQYEEEPRGLRKQIEEQAAKAREAEARAAAAERQLAFAKAGLDLADPKMSYFVKGYDGEADPEKIRAAATEAGFLGAPEPEVPTQELAQHQAAANLAASGTVEPPDSNAEYQGAMAQARSKEEVLALMDRYGSARSSYIQ